MATRSRAIEFRTTSRDFEAVGLFGIKAYYHLRVFVWDFGISYGSRPQLRLSRPRRRPPVRASIQPARPALPRSHLGAVQGAGLPRPERRDKSGRPRRSSRNQADELGSTDRSHGGGRVDRAAARPRRPARPPPSPNREGAPDPGPHPRPLH